MPVAAMAEGSEDNSSWWKIKPFQKFKLFGCLKSCNGQPSFRNPIELMLPFWISIS